MRGRSSVCASSWRVSMPDLEHELRALGGELAWPVTPDLAASVSARLPAHAARPHREWAGRRDRRLVLALVAALLLIPSAAMAVPGPRHAILEALGLRHVKIERRPR